MQSSFRRLPLDNDIFYLYKTMPMWMQDASSSLPQALSHNITEHLIYSQALDSSQESETSGADSLILHWRETDTADTKEEEVGHLGDRLTKVFGDCWRWFKVDNFLSLNNLTEGWGTVVANKHTLTQVDERSQIDDITMNFRYKVL